MSRFEEDQADLKRLEEQLDMACSRMYLNLAAMRQTRRELAENMRAIRKRKKCTQPYESKDYETHHCSARPLHYRPRGATE